LQSPFEEFGGKFQFIAGNIFVTAAKEPSADDVPFVGAGNPNMAWFTSGSGWFQKSNRQPPLGRGKLRATVAQELNRR